ncbi:hypothetical protein [Bacillus tropicus]|uniref:hypothetical protein n=1 Tax=Bacillus tropicus TaxID=2026188 RepID=UPI0020797C4B|nr:hypothetical protein [Bacillus tropicus]USK98224.1 hypothetical protein LIS81_06550 [Bacillus tropicus]
MSAFIRCLYYPYSRTLSLQTLKKSVLLFDEIAFIDTQPQFVRNQLTSQIVSEMEREEIDSAYSYLASEGVVHFLDPIEIINNNDELLTFNILDDISDDKFCKLAIQYSSNTWEILRERIPPSFLKEFYPGAGTFAEAISLQALINAKGNREQLDDWSRKFVDFRWKNINVEEAWEIFSQRYRGVIGGNPHIELEAYELPFLHASALRLNEALLVCSTNNYIPFTDSKIHDRLLINKTSRAVEEVVSNPELYEYITTNLPLNLPQQHLSLIVLDKLIPEQELEKRSLQELIEYRQENQEPLRRLREKIAEVSTSIELGKEGLNYQASMNRLVDSKIVPEITKTRDEVLKKYEEAFGRLSLRSLQATGATLITTSLAGMGLTEILIAGAVAQTGVLTTVGANEVVKIWQASKDRKRNSFSYLTNL